MWKWLIFSVYMAKEGNYCTDFFICKTNYNLQNNLRKYVEIKSKPIKSRTIVLKYLIFRLLVKAECFWIVVYGKPV